MMPLYRKPEALDAKNGLCGTSGLGDACIDTSVGISQSPSFLEVQDPAITPLSATEFNTLPFDFDITALNQFLTSGDFDALITQSHDLPHTNDVSVTPTPRQYPGPSDAIKAAWFTNMEEKDLENEAANLRSSPYHQGNGDLHGSARRREYQDSDTNGGGHIDEAWRQNVNSILVPQIFNLGPLPSIDFLVCIAFGIL